MATVRCLALLCCVVGASALAVSPIDKVVNLIQGLKKEVEDETKAELAAYTKFACFCKDKTSGKSDSIKKGNDKINTLSSDIADKTQSKKDDITELGQRKKKQEELSVKLDETTAQCAKEKATYEAEEADLSKAISSLKSAVKAMKGSKPSAASLITVKSVVQKLFSSSVITRSSATTQKRAAAFSKSRVDPTDPEYDFHSNDIIELCEQLLKDFKDEKKDLDSEWSKTDKGCKETKASLRKEMSTNKNAMDNLDKEIAKLATEIAQHRADLVEADGIMKDDELYLKDLTKRCEDRANDFDQRSAMHADEFAALKQAEDILTGSVKDRADAVNKRALLQTVKATPKVVKGAPLTAADRLDASAAFQYFAKFAKPKAVSFFQGELVTKQASSLRGRADASESLELEAKKNKALEMLRGESRRLGSVTIASLTARVAADPFKKVKGLIQKLIERLLKESAAEATKKGFCDTALGKAEHDRDARFQEAQDLSREVKKLEAKEDELSEEISVLTKEIKAESSDLDDVTEDREKEKDENMKTLKTAKEGLDAVTDALQVLKSFYSSAAKAASLLQASPVDEDTSGPGFSGSYQGKQGGMKAVFALLETIQSDFDRTLRTTDEAESKAHREFVEFSQTSKSSIAGKKTKKELNTQDLKTTRVSIEEKMSDLQSNMDLLDKALQELEELKPTCIDTGMSYSERVKKREEEMRALNKALDILRP